MTFAFFRVSMVSGSSHINETQNVTEINLYQVDIFFIMILHYNLQSKWLPRWPNRKSLLS